MTLRQDCDSILPPTTGSWWPNRATILGRWEDMGGGGNQMTRTKRDQEDQEEIVQGSTGGGSGGGTGVTGNWQCTSSCCCTGPQRNGSCCPRKKCNPRRLWSSEYGPQPLETNNKDKETVWERDKTVLQNFFFLFFIFYNCLIQTTMVWRARISYASVT